MVQEVESFGSELEVYRFSNVCPLHDGQIVIGLERSAENVAADVTNEQQTSAAMHRHS